MLLDEIGAGGMGSVWRARHRDTGEIVAVKLLRDGLAGDEDLVLRFVQERNVMRSLHHPNIVTLRDFVIEGERLALVMDLVEGGDLRALLRRRGTLPPAEAAGLMAQVAEALAAAHALGIVHRDVKPGNVLLDGATGRTRLTDFGVARIVHGPGLTQTTSIIGTPSYLSPEVADGGAATPAVDVYAAGLILYELLAGRPPFVGEHPMALLRLHATAAPRRLPGMPDPLWRIISDCAAKDPAGRPHAGEVAAALRGAAPSLAGLPALPPVAREDAPAVTSEPLPSHAGRPDPAVQGTPHAWHVAGPGPSVHGMSTPPHVAGQDPAARGAATPPGNAVRPGPDAGGAVPPPANGAHPSAREAAAPGAGTITSGDGGAGTPARRGPFRRPAVLAAVGAALTLTAAAVAFAAPWRASDAEAVGDRIAAEVKPTGGPAGEPTGEPADSTVTDTLEGSKEKSPSPSSKDPKDPKDPEDSKERSARSRTTETAAPTRPARPSPEKPAARRTPSSESRTAEPERSKTATEPEPAGKRTAEPPRQVTEPAWRCRSWISTGAGTGTEMSPCIAMVGDVFHLMGRIRGSSSVRSDVHVQLYDTDNDTNISQPFVCSGVAPPGDGAISTCGPFTVTVPRIGTKHDVRQRWKRTGTASYGGGVESPWTLW
ncbi:serine/threonine-protein kinase [Streptosporangium pseudovulgare]|uniref:serine/threonine-protein kinase n=1 Tax=Streptosporangium pseudovulgare TaxID=35765 RepID=UPI00167010BE|nr:serine/threonine-protein kinase [Streptosporangium pseudovulgare]